MQESALAEELQTERRKVAKLEARVKHLESDLDAAKEEGYLGGGGENTVGALRERNGAAPQRKKVTYIIIDRYMMYMHICVYVCMYIYI